VCVCSGGHLPDQRSVREEGPGRCHQHALRPGQSGKMTQIFMGFESPVKQARAYPQELSRSRRQEESTEEVEVSRNKVSRSGQILRSRRREESTEEQEVSRNKVSRSRPFPRN
jgi:hypothetical protein